MATMLKIWTLRLTTFFLWTLAAASVAFWALQQVSAASSADAEGRGGSSKLLAQAGMGLDQTHTADQVALVLGAKTAAMPTDASKLAANQARFQLFGVLAVGAQNRAAGAALLSVDGKPAKPYRVGVPIEDGLEVTSLAARSVSIGSNGVASFTLDLPIKE
jgi:general secretion pathway protein C